MQEEIFGPVVAFSKAKDFDELLEIANNTEYGLTGAVISNNRRHLERARHEFHVGNLYFNRTCTGAIVGYQPFGGFNMSGTDSKVCTNPSGGNEVADSCRNSLSLETPQAKRGGSSKACVKACPPFPE